MSVQKSEKSVVGVDVGGTFTDLFCFDEAARTFRVAKVPSQRGDESAGFLQGLLALGEIENFGSIVHGTTVGTNTLLERRGPRIGVITTRGFRDVLEMRRRDRQMCIRDRCRAGARGAPRIAADRARSRRLRSIRPSRRASARALPTRPLRVRNGLGALGRGRQECLVAGRAQNCRSQKYSRKDRDVRRKNLSIQGGAANPVPRH